MVNRRSVPRSRRVRLAGSTGTVNLTVLVIIIVLVMGGAFWWSHKEQTVNAIDETTLCPKDSGPVAMTVMLIDLTDPITLTQKLQLLTWFEKEISDAVRGTQFTMGIVSENSDEWGSTDPLCKPQYAGSASALTQNASLIEQKYRKRFLEPLQANIMRMVTSSSAKKSPIMESLQTLVSETPNFITFKGPKRLVIVSDLLQNSDALSFYKGEDWQSFRTSPDFQRVGSTLTNAEVVILQIPRPFEGVEDPETLEIFWTKYFDLQGAHLPIVKKLGDL